MLLSMAADINHDDRVAWVDGCKGICIVLVVYGHVAGGLEVAGVVKAGSVIIGLREWIYLFHMPAFFFLSGLWARKACERTFPAFWLGKMKTLAYPYVVWTGIIFAAQIAMTRFANNAPDGHRALRFLYEPYGYGMWFLYSLFLISLGFYGLSRLKIPALLVALMGVALYLFSRHNAFGFWPILNTSMAYAIFYLLGGSFSGMATGPLKDARLPILWCGGAGLFALVTVLQTIPFDVSGLLGLVMAWLGIFGAICLAMALVRTVAGGLFTLLGIYSLEIFVAHPLWGTASRALLGICRVHTPWIFLVSGVGLGVAGSLAMAVLCQRYGFPYLFRWPTKKAGVGQSKPAGPDRANHGTLAADLSGHPAGVRSGPGRK
jgi:fucose 4-O-acetylase-like acetyltransferase